LKLTHKKNFPAQNFEPTQPVKDKKPKKRAKGLKNFISVILKTHV